MAKNQYEFKAEIKQLLDILVHSLYTNKEIFLRELISNSSDALEKLRFKLTSSEEVAYKDLPLEIKINIDDKNNLLTISDSGIGMTEEELINNIGVIARSGSSEFLKSIQVEKKENQQGELLNLIGKFGVGFYSVFMVASEVKIITRSFYLGSKAFEWVSDGLGSYSITEIDDEIKRGTAIQIKLREEEKRFIDKDEIKDIITKHSNFIQFPIYLQSEKINTITAIWKEPKFSLKDEQYKEFFNFHSHYSEPPLTYLHISVDAPIQFNSLLYIPQKNYDIFNIQRSEYGPDLYVRRVLIQKKFKQILPEYLNFIEGIVDSEDIPLNISRETLQENNIVIKIGQNIKNQIFDHLLKMANENKEKYEQFWREHSKIFKFAYTDYSVKDKFAELMRFNSSSCENEKDIISFADYLMKLKEGQKEIFYLTGSGRNSIEQNPLNEIFRKKDIEVIYLFDPMDEFVLEGIGKYKEYEIKSVENADLKLIEKYPDKLTEKKESEKLSGDQEKDLAKLILKIEDVLKDKITKVEISKRLTNSPCCLVSPDGSYTSHIQKIMSLMNKDVNVPKKVFEINKDHKIIRNLLVIFSKNPSDRIIDKIIEQLYESSLLIDGYLNDPNKFVNRVNEFLEKATDYEAKN